MDGHDIDYKSLVQNILEASYDLLYVLDSQGNYLYCNRAFEELFRKYFKDTSPIGCNYFDSLDKRYREDRLKTFLPLADILRKKGSYRIVTEFFGGYYDNNLYYVNTGERELVVVYGKNITDRKQIEDLYNRNRKLLEITFNSMDDIVLVISPDYTVELANEQASEFTGRQIDGITGASLFDLFPYLERHELKEDIDEVIRNHRSQSSRRRINKDGNSLLVEIRKSPVVYDDGTVSVLIIIRDITQTANLEHRMLEVIIERLSSQEKEVFTRLGRNMPSKVIAAELELSEGTVSSIKCRIKNKLNLKDQKEVQKVAAEYLR